MENGIRGVHVSVGPLGVGKGGKEGGFKLTMEYGQDLALFLGELYELVCLGTGLEERLLDNDYGL